MTIRPIAALDIWQPVIDAADGRCQCTGSCGKRHLDKDRKPGRCDHEQGQHLSKVGEIRLVAAPEDVTSKYPPPGVALLAWCQPCFDGRRRLINRAAKQAPPQSDGLFDADEYVVRPESTKQAEVGRA